MHQKLDEVYYYLIEYFNICLFWGISINYCILILYGTNNKQKPNQLEVSIWIS